MTPIPAVRYESRRDPRHGRAARQEFGPYSVLEPRQFNAVTASGQALADARVTTEATARGLIPRLPRHLAVGAPHRPLQSQDFSNVSRMSNG